jgi:hypothetical protein
MQKIEAIKRLDKAARQDGKPPDNTARAVSHLVESGDSLAARIVIQGVD